jgi:hypothetical protein
MRQARWFRPAQRLGQAGDRPLEVEVGLAPAEQVRRLPPETIDLVPASRMWSPSWRQVMRGARGSPTASGSVGAKASTTSPRHEAGRSRLLRLAAPGQQRDLAEGGAGRKDGAHARPVAAVAGQRPRVGDECSIEACTVGPVPSLQWSLPVRRRLRWACARDVSRWRRTCCVAETRRRK